jgi:hypothetical protein
MGFSEADSRSALSQTEGNVEQAADILLSRGAPTTAAPAHQFNSQNVEEEDLQRALQASLSVSNTNPAPKKKQPLRNMRSAAATKAGKAALKRVSKGPSSKQSRSLSPISSHPNVKVPEKMSEKSKEEQILRTADRLKSSPQALDTLYKTLKTLQSNPNHPKFRKIDQSTSAYQKSLGRNAPGAEDMLLAMNYRKSGPRTLSLDFVDQATLYLGVSALEQTKLTSEYIQAKALIQFQKEASTAFHSADNSTEEAVARSNYMSKLPTEPAIGGAWIFVNLHGMEEKLQRKFDGDDTLDDVLNFIAGNGTQLVEKLKTGEWCLVDGHRNPPTPLDLQNLASKTLQYIGCWPSGKLIIQPARHTEQSNDVGSARGLGAGVL